MYTDSDRIAVRDALEEIASPLDSWGWSSAGIYPFWDPETRDVLYIGLAIDLPDRFGQHMGLVGCSAAGCKRDNQRLVRAPPVDRFQRVAADAQHSANRTSSAKALGIDLAEAKLDPMVELDPLTDDLKDLEGRLIELHRLTYGRRPPWNNMGGSVAGAKQVQGVAPEGIFELITGGEDSPFVARRTLRQLANDATAVAYEEHLHTARIRAVMFSVAGSRINRSKFNDLLAALEDPYTAGARMDAEGYLDESAPFAVQ